MDRSLQRLRSSLTSRRFLLFVVVLSVLCLIFVFNQLSLHEHVQALWTLADIKGSPSMSRTGFKKPSDVAIIGVIFYGRKASVEILDPYLKMNLAENGGFLDRVDFMVKTLDVEDLAFLDRLVQTTPSYRAVHGNMYTYGDQWSQLQPGSLVLKLDDDIVYIAPDAIPSLVEYRIKNPLPFMVSGGVVNHPFFGWVNMRRGAILPFVPSFNLPADNALSLNSLDSWRPSALPSAPNPIYNETTNRYDIGHTYHLNDIPPHVWLPLRDGGIEMTYASLMEYHSFGRWSLGSWEVATQQHYSLLSRLEDGTIDALNFGIWDIHAQAFDRFSINVVAVWADDIHANMEGIPADDEEWFSAIVPRKLKRPCMGVGSAIFAHYGYRPQRPGLAHTDVLDRYRLLAIETFGELVA